MVVYKSPPMRTMGNKMDYGKYNGKSLLVKIDTGEDEDKNPTFRELTGKCIGGNKDGIAIRERGGQTHIIEGLSILDIEETSSKLTVRWISDATATGVRQHLSDRHGMKTLEIPAYGSDALELHDKIDHGQLGHQHGDKPATRKGLSPEDRRLHDEQLLAVRAIGVAERAAALSKVATEG